MENNERWKKITKIASNKYTIISVFFVLLILFSPQSNVFQLISLKKEEHKIKKERDYYINEIHQDSLNTINIQKDINAAEKFGREHYLMKRQNEDIYIIRHSEDSSIKNTIE